MMNDPLTAWSEGMGEDGAPAGKIHWGEVGQGTLCDKHDGMYVTDLDMTAALAAGKDAGYGVYPCAACSDRYREL